MAGVTINTRGVLLVIAICVLAIVYACSPTPATVEVATELAEVKRPNIILITLEDLSPRIGVYGDVVAHTPNIDRLANQGVRFTNAFTTAGVCAPSRSSLITGVHQQTLGTMHMRTSSYRNDISGGMPYEAVVPAYVKAFPELLRAAGYYTVNRQKTDYQFGNPFTIWDETGPEADWRNAPADRPFFAMINFTQTHESYTWPPDDDAKHPMAEDNRKRNAVFDRTKNVFTNPATISVPPYYPDTPIVRANLARHYDNIAATDRLIGELLSELRAVGRYDDSIIVLTTDHGDGLPRAKRTVYDSGIHVPLIIRYPDERGADTINTEMVSFVDFAPTLLSFAGIPVAEWHQGRVIAGTAKGSEPTYVYAATDRTDQNPQRTKATRDKRFKYIRNYTAQHPRVSPNPYGAVNPIMQVLRRMDEARALGVRQASFINAPSPPEEFYDLVTDPFEMDNLIDDPAQRREIERHRLAMNNWIAATHDLSAMPEADLVANMWPDGIQPGTARPDACQQSDGLIRLSSATPGASMGVQVVNVDNEEPNRWQLYIDPLPATADTIVAKAIRYGYSESEVVVLRHHRIAVCTP